MEDNPKMLIRRWVMAYLGRIQPIMKAITYGETSKGYQICFGFESQLPTIRV